MTETETKNAEKPVEKKETKKEVTVEKAEPKAEPKQAEKKAAPKAEAKAEEKGKKQKKEAKKVDIVSENVYTIPLSGVHKSKPAYKRSNKAIKFIVAFLTRHTKPKAVKIDSSINHAIWARGDGKPPRRIQVKAAKDSEGTVTASLLK